MHAWIYTPPLSTRFSSAVDHRSRLSRAPEGFVQTLKSTIWQQLIRNRLFRLDTFAFLCCASPQTHDDNDSWIVDTISFHCNRRPSVCVEPQEFLSSAIETTTISRIQITVKANKRSANTFRCVPSHIRRCVNKLPARSVSKLFAEKPHSGRNYQHSCLTIKPSLFFPIIVKRVGHTQSLRTTYKQAWTSLEAAGKIIDNQFHASTATNFHTSLSMSLNTPWQFPSLSHTLSLSRFAAVTSTKRCKHAGRSCQGGESCFGSLIKLFFVLPASMSIFKCFSFLWN